MKKLACFVIVCALMGFHRAQAAPDGASESGFQLTVELKDGSRVVAKTLDDSLSFHSSALGDMKLPWSSIRSLEYTDDNTARLTATNGDALTVQLAMDTLPVQTGFGKTELPVKLIRSIKVSPPASPAPAPAPGETGWRLMIALRDGSHLVGKGLDDTVDFHSAGMGDLKLSWAGIHSIEYANTGSETARLTTTNGDVYAVQFAAATVGVETSFGKTELPVKLIQSIQVSAMTGPGQLPSGLVALWSGEGNGDDSVGGNNAILTDISFADGKVGQAFCLDGHSSYLTVPASPSLNVGTGDGLTITAWIKPNAFDVDVSGAPIIEWDSETTDGCELWSGGSLFVNIRDLSGNGHTVNFPYAFDTNNFQFVAMTYDKNSGNIVLYINGVAVASKNYGSFTPQTTYPVNIGRRTGQPVGNGDTYGGLIDELAIYNRALSASEIEAVYAEQK